MAVALRTAPAGGFLMRSTSTRLVLASWQYNLLRISEYWGSAEREETCMLWSGDQPESGADVENFSCSLQKQPKTPTKALQRNTDWIVQLRDRLPCPGPLFNPFCAGGGARRNMSRHVKALQADCSSPTDRCMGWRGRAFWGGAA